VLLLRLGGLSVAVGMSVPQVVGGQIGRYADRASCRVGSRDDPGGEVGRWLSRL
jgi:hypothetical protein